MKLSRLRLLRAQVGLNLKQMAEALDVNPTQLCRLELGFDARASKNVNEKLIRVFGESYDFLKEMVDVPDPENIMDKIRAKARSGISTGCKTAA